MNNQPSRGPRPTPSGAQRRAVRQPTMHSSPKKPSTPQHGPTPSRPPRPRPTASYGSHRTQRHLTPLGLCLLAVALLLIAGLVFALSYFISYKIEYARLERAASAGTQTPTPDSVPTPNEGGTTPDPNTEGNNSGSATHDQPPSSDTKPEPEVKFASLQEVIDYVDNLGINYANLAAFDMSPYFKAVTLDETADAGVQYQNETAYIGDSLVLHMTSRSSQPREMVFAKESITPAEAYSEQHATLKNGTKATFAEAMRELQPKRIVISIGTNSLWMDPIDYLTFFSLFIDDLKAACPQAEIILQSTPPVDADWEVGKNFSNNKTINRFNLYLAGLATYHDIWFLDSAPLLKNAGGTLDGKYNNGDGFHITSAAYDVWTNYLRTHATTLQP